MSPIDGVARALEIFRRRLAGGAARPAAASASPAASPQGSSRHGEEHELREAVASRLQGLDPADTGYLDRATEVFVEGVLLSEFGSQLTNDPKFRQVIRAVSREMASTPESAAELETLFRGLRRG